jgi:hypothetical protein
MPARFTCQIGLSPSNGPVNGTSRIPPAIMAARYLQVSGFAARLRGRADQKDATTQLINQPIHMISSTWFGWIVTISILHCDAGRINGTHQAHKVLIRAHPSVDEPSRPCPQAMLSPRTKRVRSGWEHNRGRAGIFRSRAIGSATQCVLPPRSLLAGGG